MVCCIVLVFFASLCVGGQKTTEVSEINDSISDGKERSESSTSYKTDIEKATITSRLPTETLDYNVDKTHEPFIYTNLTTTASASELGTSMSIKQISVSVEDDVSSIIQVDQTIDESSIGLTDNDEVLFTTPPKDHLITGSESTFNKSANAFTTSLWNISVQSTTAMLRNVEDECFQYTKCKPDTMQHWYCSCDMFCQEYNDCCYPPNVTTSSKPPNNKYLCMNRGSPPRTGEIFTEAFFVIAKCATEDRSMQEKCTSNNVLETGPPVVSKNDKTMIFKNKYCAVCNNETQFLFFDILFTAKNKDLIYDMERNKSITNEEKINFFITSGERFEFVQPDEARIRWCSDFMAKFDSPSCQKYNSPVRIRTQDWKISYYRNIFCFQSTGEKIRKMYCISRFYEDWFGGEIDPGSSIHSLSVIFSFTEKNEKRISSCDEWTPKMKDTGQCSNELSVMNVKEDLEYYLTVNENSTNLQIKQMVFLTFWAKLIPNIGYIEPNLGSQVQIYGNIIKVKTKLIVKKRSFLGEVQRIIKAFTKQKILIFIKSDNSFYSVETVQEKGLNKISAPSIYVLSNSVKDVLASFSLYKIIAPSEVIMEKFCNDIAITVKQIADDFIKVETVSCKSTSETPRNVSILAILTYIFFGISVISLVILILCYRKNKLYMDVPSSNLENIALSTMTANILFLCGIGATNLQKVCYAVSIALHYVWLASFSFTSLAVIYIVSTILKMRARRIINKEVQAKHRRVITVVGLLIPIMFVGPAIVIDQYGPEYLSPGYGGLVCFPTKFPGNLIFFSGPVMVSILTNLVCLITVMIKLHIVTMATNQIRQSSTYRQSKVYLRLIILSGVLWISGILAVIFQSEWLEYAFTFLCGLHGFFLCVANLTTIKVRRPRKNSTETT